jgi:hypothetical protein
LCCPTILTAPVRNATRVVRKGTLAGAVSPEVSRLDIAAIVNRRDHSNKHIKPTDLDQKEMGEMLTVCVSISPTSPDDPRSRPLTRRAYTTRFPRAL